VFDIASFGVAQGLYLHISKAKPLHKLINVFELKLYYSKLVSVFDAISFITFQGMSYKANLQYSKLVRLTI
jgi:hypothetical protein